MMRYTLFLSALLVMIHFPCWAQEYETANTIKAQVEALVQSEMTRRFPQKIPNEDMSIQVSNLDSRLKLAKCDQAIDSDISNANHGSNFTVKLSCRGTERWSVYVPAKVEIFANVVVASQNLQRGDILQEADLITLKMNTSHAGYGHVEKMERLLGMELKRAINSGAPIRLSHVKSPDIVKKGEKVQLTARTRGLAVITSATALANGHAGEQIRVQNSESKRVVDAMVVAPGAVEISLH